MGRLTGPPAPELHGDHRALHRHIRQVLTDEAELVVIVDQCEEVFTLCRDETEREVFLDALFTAALGQHSRCRVVLGVRADFYAHCTASAPLAEAVCGGQITLGPITTDEQRQMITQPAAARVTPSRLRC